MLVTVSLTLLLVVVSPGMQGQDLIQPGPPDFCFKGDDHVLDHFHKDAPSPEENDFPECTSWQESSCCTHALADELSRFSKALGDRLYNFTVGQCGSLSQECAQYIRVRIPVHYNYYASINVLPHLPPYWQKVGI